MDGISIASKAKDRSLATKVLVGPILEANNGFYIEKLLTMYHW